MSPAGAWFTLQTLQRRPDPERAPALPRPILRTRTAALARAYAHSFSFVGLVVAALFSSASMTPSLLPRRVATQGLLSGFAAAAGYGLGVLGVWLYGYLELRPLTGRARTLARRVAAVAAGLVFVAFQWRMTFWQNDLRARMGVEPLASAAPWRTALVSALTAAVLVALGRGALAAVRFTTTQLHRVMPCRTATALSVAAVGLTTVFIANGVLARGLHTAADHFFLALNARLEPAFAPPFRSPSPGVAPLGGEGSLLPWKTVGRFGRQFVAGGPASEDITALTGRPARDPVRVYAGLQPDQSIQQSADLALEELKRLGGFDRRVLIIATPTGTGWIDPGAADTVEFIHNGDTATVAMQYSYLPSWMTLLIDPDRPVAAARALFEAVYAHWTALPRDTRPRLYLHGLSLGALGSAASASLLTLIEDPIHGALWSGPPFPSARWQEATAYRNPGSPAWLPQVHDGRMLRFVSPEHPADPSRPWGPIRSVYLQHASDPMTFFSPELFWHRPDWLAGPRGPDVSPHLRWYPVVTGLQLAFDLAQATTVPFGHGHNYAAADYLDAWISVTAPAHWTRDDTAGFKRALAARADQSLQPGRPRNAGSNHWLRFQPGAQRPGAHPGEERDP